MRGKLDAVHTAAQEVAGIFYVEVVCGRVVGLDDACQKALVLFFLHSVNVVSLEFVGLLRS